ncbi:6-bladed beta-propeller, partial [Bacteroides fragilis]
GRYVADIGGVGQGPGEYLYLFSWLVDEKENRIYLGPGRADKVLVYDLKGNYLPDEVIRFGEIVHKSQIWVDYDKKNVVVVTLPFSANVNSNFAINKNVCWVQ